MPGWIERSLRPRLRRLAASFHFWRDRNRDVDLLVHRAGRFRQADMTWSQTPEFQTAQPLRKVRDFLLARGVEGSAVFCRAANRWWRGSAEGSPAQGTTEDGLGGGGAGPSGRHLAGAHPSLGSAALISAFHVLRPPGQCRGRKPG